MKYYFIKSLKSPLMNSNVGCFTKQPLVQFIIMPKLMKAPRTDELAYIFYNYKVTYKPLFQSSHL